MLIYIYSDQFFTAKNSVGNSLLNSNSSMQNLIHEFMNSLAVNMHGRDIRGLDFNPS